MLMTMVLCIYGDWPVITMRRRLSIPLDDAFWKSWYKGQRVIKSAGVVGGRILSVFSPPRAFRGRHLLTPSLFSTIICFGSGWHFIVPFHFPVFTIYHGH